MKKVVLFLAVAFAGAMVACSSNENKACCDENAECTEAVVEEAAAEEAPAEEVVVEEAAAEEAPAEEAPAAE